jgi:MFS family permease
MNGWFVDLTEPERATFWACFWGWALDATDVQIYALIMPTLITLWALTKTQAGLLATVALIVSSLGGWLAGMLADRIGRIRVLQITIVWFSVFTAISGLTHSFGQLMIVRSLQGLGFGGEWAAGAVLISETIRREFRGRAVGTVQGGWSVGYGIAVALFWLAFWIFPRDIAWRALFFVGLLPAVLIMFLLRKIEEPAIFLQSQKQAHRTGAEFLLIFRRPLLSRTATASLLATAVLGANYTVLAWLPTYLSLVRNLSIGGTGLYLIINILGSFCGYLSAAHVSDYYGRRRTFMVYAILAAITVSTYMFLPLANSWLLLLGFPLGFCQSGIVGVIGAAFAELFPTEVRATGQGFSYNVGRGIGAILPTAVGVISSKMALGTAIGLCAMCAYGVVAIAALMLPETKNAELKSN